jgi:hypothetical protein
MDPHKPSKDERDFVRVVKFSAALGMGLMAGFLYSLKQVHPSIRLELTFGTVLAFLITAAFVWMFCGVLFKGEFSDGDSAGVAAIKKRRVARWVLFFVVISALGTAGAFLYSLKDVSAGHRRDVLVGTGVAVIVIATGVLLIHKAVRFFEEQDRVNLEEQQKERQDEDGRDG